MKKLFAFLLALMAGVVTLFAASGTSGSLHWDLTDGVLTISGNATMNDYDTYSSIAPWHSLRESITSVVIQDGVKSIGAYAFRECASMTSVTIPNSVTGLGEQAFSNCTGLTSITIPTAVDQVPSGEPQSTKVLMDGLIYILRDGKTFAITGQKVN